jgi:uncharacterized protein (DUF1499 family)
MDSKKFPRSEIKKMLLWIMIIFLGLISFLALLSIISRKKPITGMINGRLRLCSRESNCVCSEDKDLPSFVEPLSFSGPANNNWEKAKKVIQEMGGKIVSHEDDYLWAIFHTRIFRFVDDMELRMDEDAELIHVGSSSRVGYSDMGVNRKRIEDFRARFNKSNNLSTPDTK